MSRRMALIATSALTAFVLIALGALAVRIGASNADSAPASVADQAGIADPASGSLSEREQIYQQRLEEANAQLQQAFEKIQQLDGQLQQARTQNAILLQREQIYQQRLQEAGQLLQQRAPATQSALSSATNQFQFRGDEREGEHAERDDD